MNLDTLKSKYLVSSLLFDDKTDILKDNCNRIWMKGYTYRNINSGSGTNNIKTVVSTDAYRTNILYIPKSNASISMVKDIELGGKPFTIDFWMNLAICTTEANDYDKFAGSDTAWFSIDIGDDIYCIINYNKGLYFNYHDSKSLNGFFRENNPSYFTSEAYQIISAKNNSLHHIILSYNPYISNNHPKTEHVLNFYIDGNNVVDTTKYQYLEIARKSVVINIMNLSSSNVLYLSNFRIWDGVAIEIDEDGVLSTSDNDTYIDTDFIIDSTDIINKYDGIAYNE